jgi:hypothetical protein
MKFSTPMGALSGNNVQVIFPAVVLMIAVGFVAVAGLEVVVAGFAAPLDLAAPVFAAGALCLGASDCAKALSAINIVTDKIAKLLRISAP